MSTLNYVYNSIDVNNNRSTKDVSVITDAKNIACLKELNASYPYGRVLESNVKYDEDGFEYFIPNTVYSVCVNRRYVSIRKSGESIVMVTKKLSEQPLAQFERALENTLMKYF